MTTDSTLTKILLVEDVDIIRIGLRITLEQMHIFDVIVEAVDGPSAVSKARELMPHVVLMDIGLPGFDGVEASRKIKEISPQTKIIMFTSHESDQDVFGAFGAGADGYCLKTIGSEMLATAIRTVMTGSNWVDPGIAGRVLKSSTSYTPRGSDPTAITKLTLAPQELVINQANSAMVTLSNGKETPRPQAIRAPLAANEIFANKYIIEHVIGMGGMSIVYKARHSLIHKPVAIKMLQLHLLSDENIGRRFQQEAEAASTLNHPHAVSVFDYGITDKGQPYLVMDYIDGINLDDLIEKEPHQSMDRLINIFIQVCEALASAHAAGIVHRDLKPTNIMLTTNDSKEDWVKIIDFGLAKITDGDKSKLEKLTSAGEVFGSVAYMSPEQCQGKVADWRTDIYSLGCVMYQAFTGKPLFDGSSPFEFFMKHINYMPERFSVRRPDKIFPFALERIVFKALNKEVDKRYQSAEDIKDDLQQLVKSAEYFKLQRA